MSAGCGTCGAPLGEEHLVCHYCGTARRRLLSPEEQRASLDELRQAMARATHEAAPSDEVRVRDRFLQNGFIPSDPDLLIEAALHCHQFFGSTLGSESGVPLARFETCLTRLELLAADTPSLGEKAAILRRKLRAQRAPERRRDVALALWAIGLLAALVAGGVWLVRAAFG